MDIFRGLLVQSHEVNARRGVYKSLIMYANATDIIGEPPKVFSAEDT